VRFLGLRLAAAVCAASTLIGCAGGPPKPAQVSGTVQASPQLNPSTTRRPSPLLVRMYELKSVAVFNAADFISLYQRDQAELGTDLIAKEEFVLGPGETKLFTKTLSPDTRFLGVIGAFRDVEHAKWRSSVAIQPGQQQKIVIRAGELAVEATAVR
jgi:type VI secretion system protein VasD